MKQTWPLAPRVFLAFDDLSRAGKHVVRLAKMKGARALPVPRTLVETLLPLELSSFVQMFQWPDNQAMAIVVKTSEVQASQRWELADALVSALSHADVQQLTIVAALHLPYAKDNGLNVFYSTLPGLDDPEVDVTRLARADPSWEVKDPWLSALLHLIYVEQWPRTHLLLAKGYKPGRDMSGTYEAVEALSRAVALFTKGTITCDDQDVQRKLPRLLATGTSATLAASNDPFMLLYN